MAIQGTQVRMYTKHTLFLYFSEFFFFYMKDKAKQNWKKKIVKQPKHKTRLTQNLKANHISNAHTKQEEREKSDRITLSFFPSTP